jgi:hypothetical protein
MLTRLGLGRTAVLRASATGLLAFATAITVGVGAWVLADNAEVAPTAQVTAIDGTRPEPALVSHRQLRGLERAEAEINGPTADTTAAALLASAALELNSSGPFMEADPGAWFRIHDAVPRPEPEPVVQNERPAPVVPAAVELSDTPELLPGDRVRTTVSFYYCEHDPESVNPSGDGGGFCGVMRDGSTVYPGAAACSYAYLGQRFRILGDPTGRIYRCADTGSAVDGQHRDIWFQTSDEGWNWLWVTGATATIEVVE